MGVNVCSDICVSECCESKNAKLVCSVMQSLASRGLSFLSSCVFVSCFFFQNFPIPLLETIGSHHYWWLVPKPPT